MEWPEWVKAVLDVNWPAWSVGGVLVLLGLWLAWRGVLGDRARGRRRCPRCWYDLRGTPGMRCSECGFAARSERTLHKSRRRWRVAACGGVAVLVGGATAVVPQIRRDGWLSVVPTSVLILVTPADANAASGFPFLGPNPSPAEAELARRQAGGSLYAWQWAYLARHRFLQFRRVWPEQFPLTVYGRTPDWIGSGGVYVGLPNDEVAVTLDGLLWTSETYQEVGSFRACAEGVDVRCTVARGTDTWRVPSITNLGAGSAETPWGGIIRLPIRVVANLPDAIRPLRGATVDESMRRALTVTVGQVPRSGCNMRAVAGLLVRLDRSHEDSLLNVGFGFVIEVVRDGAIVETLFLEPTPPDALLPRLIQGGDWHVFRNIPVHDLRSGDATRRYTLRVRGDAGMALRDWDKTEYWDGEFTIPLSEVVRR